MPALFLVTSPGYTATKWLARSLNAHPEIYCNHSAGSDVLERDYTPDELSALAEEKLGGARDALPLDTFLKGLERRAPAGAVAVGNVHRYNLTALQRNTARWPGACAYNTLNLVRHPVPWIASGAAQLGVMVEGSPVIRKRLETHWARHVDLYRDLGVPEQPEPSQLAFCYLCARMRRLVSESQIEGVTHIPAEELTREPGVFLDVVRGLTGLRLDRSGEHLRQVFARGAIHRHSRRSDGTPRERFASWANWEQEVFRYWARESGIQEAYAAFGYPAERVFEGAAPPRAQAPSPRASPCPSATLRAACEGTFDRVRARRLSLWFLELGGKRVLARLGRELAEAGLGKCLRAPERYMSPGLEGGAPPLLEPEVFAPSEGGWRVAVVHHHLQDRSPAVLCHHAESGALFAINLKGAGLRTPRDSFVSRSARYPEYRATLRDDLLKPIDVLIGNPENEWLSQKLIGGTTFLTTLVEARHALSWHRLLYRLDGSSAATCIPLRIWRPEQLTVRVGPAREPRSLATWDLLTHPELLSRAQLERVADDVNPLSVLLDPLRMFAVRRFRLLLKGDPKALIAARQLRRAVGELYQRGKGPIVYEHVTRAKLRIGHAWDQLTEDAEVRARLAELGIACNSAGIARLVLMVMTEVYAANGEVLRAVGAEGLELTNGGGRLAYVAALYRANRASAERIMSAVGRAAGRTLGALHGAGGHCLGRRLKLRDRRGEKVRDAQGLVVRMGAPGGGSAAKRNVTVCGELVDTSHLFNPRYELVSWGCRWLSVLLPIRFAWASPRHVQAFQQSDLQQAEESMLLFDALLTGDGARVPAELAEIEQARARRKHLEDVLRGEAASERAGRVAEIEALELKLKALRRALPPFAEGRTLLAFRAAYEGNLVRSRALHPTPGKG
ncbi:MAG: hypothetical protein JKY65_14320 [Planctomycetes bacterium]|nr:hypothetical protein [Planctomycetota bacterium]